MLLLVTIGLVLVGAVSLVIGFVSNSLAPIYLSIACSVIAGIVLVVFSRMGKRQEAGGPSSSGFKPAPSGGTWTPPPAPPAPPPPPSFRAPTTPEPEPATEPVGRAPVAAAPAPASTVAVADDEFPIAGYDTLRVSQILPALDDLDLDELDVVREREEQGKNRTTVLRRIDVLMDELEAEEGGEVIAAAEVEVEPEMDEDLGDDGDLDDDLDADALDEDQEDLDVAFAGGMDSDREPAPTAVMPAVAASDGAAGGSFPIPGYDRLPVAQILPLLDDLDDDELDMVAEYEEQGKNRAAILDRIDDMFEPIDDEVPPPAPPPPAPPPVKRAPAKRGAVKKVTPPVKVTPVKRAPAKRAPVEAAPVKKAAVKRGAAKQAAPVMPPELTTRPAAKKKKAAPAAAKRSPAVAPAAAKAAKKVVKKR